MKWFLLILCLPLLATCSALPVYGPLFTPETPSAIGRQISITTWNLGYGALGAGADFIADGGAHLRSLPKPVILTASRNIAATARGFDSDLLLFQELAKANFLTRNVPLLATVETALPAYTPLFWEGLHLSEPPDPLALSHGLGVFAKNGGATLSVRELPQEENPMVLGIRRYYGALVAELPIKGSTHKWVLINIHLAAFDDGATIRRAQAVAVLEYAQSEYAKGHYIVIAGDWNMRLAPDAFAHDTEPEYLEWLVDFPPNLLPQGWNIGADPSIPTVRTLQKPYVAGDNYTAIIDGFVTSPNVATLRVKTLDMAFQYTDHQPVTGVFRAR